MYYLSYVQSYVCLLKLQNWMCEYNKITHNQYVHIKWQLYGNDITAISSLLIKPPVCSYYLVQGDFSSCW